EVGAEEVRPGDPIFGAREAGVIDIGFAEGEVECLARLVDEFARNGGDIQLQVVLSCDADVGLWEEGASGCPVVVGQLAALQAIDALGGVVAEGGCPYFGHRME